MIHSIRLYGDEILRRPAAHVTDFGEHLKRLSEDLIATQAQMQAIGLAAVQIGIGANVFSIDGSQVERRGRREVLVNPEIVDQGGEITDEEGCLSFPGIFVRIRRPEWVIVRARNLEGREIEREAKGYIARAYIHEIDHLRGRLFTDLMDPDTRVRVITKMQSLKTKTAPCSPVGHFPSSCPGEGAEGKRGA